MSQLLFQKIKDLCNLLEKNSQGNSEGNIFKYSSVECFVLIHGKYFTSFSKIPVTKGQFQCYFHAANLALSNSKFTYVEGYILNPTEDFFISHAWVVDEKGRIIETALQNDYESWEYFGVPFRTDFIHDRLNKEDSQGLFQAAPIDILKGEYDKGIKIINIP
jgi:hypothetical protein